MNDIPRGVGFAVLAEWRAVANRLATVGPAEAHRALNLPASYRERLDAEIAAHREDIAQLLRTLADECERFYQESEWICVLGM